MFKGQFGEGSSKDVHINAPGPLTHSPLPEEVEKLKLRVNYISNNYNTIC